MIIKGGVNQEFSLFAECLMRQQDFFKVREMLMVQITVGQDGPDNYNKTIVVK